MTRWSKRRNVRVCGRRDRLCFDNLPERATARPLQQPARAAAEAAPSAPKPASSSPKSAPSTSEPLNALRVRIPRPHRRRLNNLHRPQPLINRLKVRLPEPARPQRPRHARVPMKALRAPSRHAHAPAPIRQRRHRASDPAVKPAVDSASSVTAPVARVPRPAERGPARAQAGGCAQLAEDGRRPCQPAAGCRHTDTNTPPQRPAGLGAVRGGGRPPHARLREAVGARGHGRVHGARGVRAGWERRAGDAVGARAVRRARGGRVHPGGGFGAGRVRRGELIAATLSCARCVRVCPNRRQVRREQCCSAWREARFTDGAIWRVFRHGRSAEAGGAGIAV